MGVLLRLLLLATLFWLVASWLRRLLAPPAPRGEEGMPPVRMHRCAQCQLHIPETDCTRAQGRFFCCEAHRDAYLNRKP